MKKITAAIAALGLAGTLALAPVPALASASFDDVPEDWYTEAVEWAHSNGLVNGIGTRTFGTGQLLTRGQLAAILWNNAGQEAHERYGGTDVKSTCHMSDVLDGQWYTAACNWAVDNGVINGYGDGTFGVDDPVTTEQFVAILGNYTNNEISSAIPLEQYYFSFADWGEVSDWASHKVAWAEDAGIINGHTRDGAKYSGPQDDITRERAVTILKNANDKNILLLDGAKGDENATPAVTESGFYRDSDDIAHYAVTVKNPSKIFQELNATINIMGMKADGSVAFVDSQRVHLLPGDTQTFAGVTGNGAEFSTIAFSLSVGDLGYTVGDSSLADNFTISDVTRSSSASATTTDGASATTTDGGASTTSDGGATSTADAGTSTDASVTTADESATDDAAAADDDPVTPTDQATPISSYDTFTGHITMKKDYAYQGEAYRFNRGARVSVVFRDADGKLLGGSYVHVGMLYRGVATPFRLTNVPVPEGTESYAVTAVPEQ